MERNSIGQAVTALLEREKDLSTMVRIVGDQMTTPPHRVPSKHPCLRGAGQGHNAVSERLLIHTSTS
jgi:hypothetical protein